MTGSTTGLVAVPRLPTETVADRIVVRHAGRIRTVGTHREPVTAGPLYAEPAATQFLAAD